MSRRHLFRWTLLLALGASVGCKKSPTCELLHERLRACLPDLAGDSAAFVATCQAREDDFEAPVACSPETACDVFDRCFQAALERAHHKDLGEARRQRVESIKEAVAKGRYREARVDCLRFEKQPPPSDVDWQSICTELPRTATAALKERMKGLREAGQPDDDLVCYQLLDFAARVSGEEGRGAEVLCDEVRTSADAARAIARAQEHVKTKRAEIPLDCDFAERELERVGTDWARSRLDAVVRACYLDLGKVILAQKPWVEGAPCEAHVGKVVRGLRRHGVKDAETDATVDKLLVPCEKEP